MRQRKTPRLGDLCEHVLRIGSSRRRNRRTDYNQVCASCDPEDPTVGVFVLVSKERLEQQWPTEKDGPEGEAFRKFAARLADAVQKALAEGKKIVDGNTHGDYCPLGCLPEAVERKPLAWPHYWDSGGMPLDSFNLKDFYRAFDGTTEGVRPESPYCRLGQAYRARFVTKAAE